MDDGERVMADSGEDEEDEDWSRPLGTEAGGIMHCGQENLTHSAANLISEAIHPRTIVHLDVDCFYAQVEMIDNPALRDVPLGVQQKYLLVTCNYVARGRGVHKMMGVAQARRVCPELVLVSGEDLTRYREMSYQISEFLVKYTPCVERLGLDENYLDVTEMVDQRVRGGTARQEVVGHLYSPNDAVCHPDTSERCACGCHHRLAVGSQIAADIRSALSVELGVTCCGGVAHNKLLAKLGGARFKPDQQTTVLPASAPLLLSTLPNVGAIPGVGWSTRRRLEAVGVVSVGDLQRCPPARLQKEFGVATATTLRHLAFGLDPTPVVAYSKPQTLSIEDSFRRCSSEDDARSRMTPLLRQLLQRAHEDGRTPRALRLTVRKVKPDARHGQRESRQCLLPASIASKITNGQAESAQDRLVSMAMQLLQKMVERGRPFHLTLLNVALTFTKMDDAPANNILNFFTSPRSAATHADTPSDGQRRGVSLDDDAESPSQQASAAQFRSAALDDASSSSPHVPSGAKRRCAPLDDAETSSQQASAALDDAESPSPQKPYAAQRHIVSLDDAETPSPQKPYAAQRHIVSLDDAESPSPQKPYAAQRHIVSLDDAETPSPQKPYAAQRHILSLDDAESPSPQKPYAAQRHIVSLDDAESPSPEKPYAAERHILSLDDAESPSPQKPYAAERHILSLDDAESPSPQKPYAAQRHIVSLVSPSQHTLSATLPHRVSLGQSSSSRLSLSAAQRQDESLDDDDLSSQSQISARHTTSERQCRGVSLRRSSSRHTPCTAQRNSVSLGRSLDDAESASRQTLSTAQRHGVSLDGGDSSSQLSAQPYPVQRCSVSLGQSPLRHTPFTDHGGMSLDNRDSSSQLSAQPYPVQRCSVSLGQSPLRHTPFTDHGGMSLDNRDSSSQLSERNKPPEVQSHGVCLEQPPSQLSAGLTLSPEARRHGSLGHWSFQRCAHTQLTPPPGVDSQVFAELPPEIQQEILARAQQEKRVKAEFQKVSSPSASQRRMRGNNAKAMGCKTIPGIFLEKRKRPLFSSATSNLVTDPAVKPAESESSLARELAVSGRGHRAVDIFAGQGPLRGDSAPTTQRQSHKGSNPTGLKASQSSSSATVTSHRASTPDQTEGNSQTSSQLPHMTAELDRKRTLTSAGTGEEGKSKGIRAEAVSLTQASPRSKTCAPNSMEFSKASSFTQAFPSSKTLAPNGTDPCVFFALPLDIQRELVAEAALQKHDAQTSGKASVNLNTGKTAAKSPAKKVNSMLNYLRKK